MFKEILDLLHGDVRQIRVVKYRVIAPREFV
jgi:hypothetical protein